MLFVVCFLFCHTTAQSRVLAYDSNALHSCLLEILFICDLIIIINNFLQKAFQHVDWTDCWKYFKNIGVNWRECQLIHNLYVEQKAKLCLNQDEN